MLGVVTGVTGYAKTDFRDARLPVHTNLNLDKWAAICTTGVDALTLEYLTVKFPAGYEGPVPTPTLHNHPSAVHHSSDVAAYITK